MIKDNTSNVDKNNAAVESNCYIHNVQQEIEFGKKSPTEEAVQEPVASTFVNASILCESGDSVLADRGFNEQDIFASKDVTINTPAFLRGKTQLPGLVVLKDREIANKRVHIERLIGMVKQGKT